MFGIKSENGYTEALPGVKIKTISYGKNTLMTEFLLAKDSILNEHQHIHEQIGYLVSGKIKLYIGNSSRILTPGDSWNIPSNIPHKAEILENSVAVEVFTPCREEYLAYLNQADVVEL